MIKYSIRRQMTAIFIGLFSLILGLVLIINNAFLGHYYLSHKADDLIRTYNDVNAKLESGSLSDSDSVRDILTQLERANVDLVVVDGGGNAILTTLGESDPRLKEMFSGLFGMEGVDHENILKRNEDYTIYRDKSSQVQRDVEYLKMWGRFMDGSWFIMQCPYASITESASLANRFLIYLGCIGMVIGGLLVWMFSRSITRPIMELAGLSQEMANLNFDTKYTRGGMDEIGVLGNNFNKMSEKLERTVSELKQANNQLQKDIEQKDKLEKMRNEFLGNVSHELKTPIALIQGYAEGLKEGVNEDAESREFYCDVIMDEASKMNQMVKNLLTLNQLEFGDEDIVFDRFNLTALVRGVLQSMEIMADQAGAKILLHTEEDIYAWADEFKVEQVVKNYVSNACHHVSGDMVIEVKMVQKDGKVRVSVFNTGTPIPEADIAHIWDKFYKVDKAHTREYGGNGIGLSIVKAIMKSFHQEYGVKNYDNGVEFWFELDVQ